jgi:hypothetical protein
MTNAKTTEMSPPNVLPTSSGVYKTRTLDPETGEPIGEHGYSYFDLTDRIWGCTSTTPEEAFKSPDFEFAAQTKEWCGLDEEPSA